MLSPSRPVQLSSRRDFPHAVPDSARHELFGLPVTRWRGETTEMKQRAFCALTRTDGNDGNPNGTERATKKTMMADPYLTGR